MARKIQLVKTGRGELAPSTEHDQNLIDSIPAGEEITVSYSFPRNPDHHKKYFALLALVVANMPEQLTEKYGTIDKLRREIMLQIGRFEVHETMGGKQTYLPQSLNFGSMDQPTFNEIYSETLDVILKWFLPGMDKEGIENEILGFL